MNICILSMQRVENFGSLLQSYALKKMLESLGCDVSFLDIEPRHNDNALLENYVLAYPNEGEQGGTLLSKLKKLDRYCLNRVYIKVLSHRQNRLFEKFRRESLEISDHDAGGKFDLCVIGSDEVFNCLSPTPWGFTSQLFGDVPQSEKVITYAASCGSTYLEELPEQVADRIRQVFTKVSAFSVRDQNTRRFVSALSAGNVREHLDPVAVTDFSNELRDVSLPANLPKRYCVVYSYYNRICEEEDIRQIRDFCRENSLEIIAVGAPQKWIRNYVITDPFSMLKIFQNAEFVITDTFHGTIFSAKYAKRFAVLIRESNRNKLADLICRLALEKHQIPSFGALKEAYGVQKNADVVQHRLECERMRTMEYLAEAMGR